MKARDAWYGMPTVFLKGHGDGTMRLLFSSPEPVLVTSEIISAAVEAMRRLMVPCEVPLA